VRPWPVILAAEGARRTRETVRMEEFIVKAVRVVEMCSFGW
jgi:hypothetical protein